MESLHASLYCSWKEIVNMEEFDYKSFTKRYHKFKDCNLPVPFWDEERQVKEYVYYEDRDDLEDWKKYNVSESIFESLSDIAFTGLYYSFTCGGYTEKDGKFIKKVEHNHAHSFEEVVKCLYDYPETFNISTEEEEFYSKQELKYLRRVQKYLLFIGFKDLGIPTYDEEGYYIWDYSRYNNELQDKYKNCRIITCKEETINNIRNGEKKYFVFATSYPELYKDEDIKNDEALIVDEQDNFKFYIKYNYYKKCMYKDIKDGYENSDLKQDDIVILEYFDVIEKY